MSIGYSDIWVGGEVDLGWVGTALPKVLLRWMPSRLSPLVVAAVSAPAAAADDDDDDGGGGGGDEDMTTTMIMMIVHPIAKNC